MALAKKRQKKKIFNTADMGVRPAAKIDTETQNPFSSDELTAIETRAIAAAHGGSPAEGAYRRIAALAASLRDNPT